MLYIQYPEWISPQVVSFLPVRWYGIMYVVAYATCYMFMLSQIRKDKNTHLETLLPNFFMWAFIIMLIFARLASELIYNKNPLILLKPWMLFWPFHNGQFVGIQGMSYHGGVLGIAIAVILYCKIHKIDLLRFIDMVSIGSAFGYTFGRLGNFINGELYGRITSMPWGMVFPRAELLPIANSQVKKIVEKLDLTVNEIGLVNVPRHPSQLYEMFLEGILTGLILFAILKITKKYKKYIPGTILGMYIFLYGMMRFIAEYFRQPDTGLDFVIRLSSKPNPNWLFVSPFNITTGQVLSSIMIVLGIALTITLIIVHRKNSIQNSIPIAAKTIIKNNKIKK